MTMMCLADRFHEANSFLGRDMRLTSTTKPVATHQLESSILFSKPASDTKANLLFDFNLKNTCRPSTIQQTTFSCNVKFGYQPMAPNLLRNLTKKTANKSDDLLTIE